MTRLHPRAFYNEINAQMQDLFRPKNEVFYAGFNDLMAYLEQSTYDYPLRVEWVTLEGKKRYYWMYWDAAAYVGNKASRTKAKKDMLNLQVIGLDGEWRTLWIETISRFRVQFANGGYKIFQYTPNFSE